MMSSVLWHGSQVNSDEEKQQVSMLPSPSRQRRLLSPRPSHALKQANAQATAAGGSARKGASASSSPSTATASVFDWPTFSALSSSSTPFGSRPVTAAPSLHTSRKHSQLLRPATAIPDRPYPSSTEPSQRDILRSTTARRAYTASPHRIPFLPATPPSPPLCPPFQAPAPASYQSSVRGPNFFLSSEQNKSDNFLAWMKATSGNYSTTDGSEDGGRSKPSNARHSHAPLISRQYAFNSHNHRTELMLHDQIRALSSPGAASALLLANNAPLSTTSFLPPSSSLSSRGGYLSHASSTRSQLPLPHGQTLSSSFTPSYYQCAAFVPVCERGPAYTFGAGRGGDDELHVKRKRLMEEEMANKERQRTRLIRENERREAVGEEKEQDWRQEGEDEADQPVVDHILLNISSAAAEGTVSSRQRRQSLRAQEEVQKRQAAQSARQALQAERTERQQLMLRRHDPAWRAQRRQQQEDAEKARILQRSWLLLITVASRVEVWRQSLEHYQKVQHRERAIKAIVHWLRRCNERRRKRRFLHARRVIRLFWEERLADLYLHDSEVEKRRAMDVVLTFLRWATSKRKQEVVRAFGSIESRVIVIQRAWRAYITAQKWRLMVQVMQFVQFNQPPELYERERERADDDSAGEDHSRASSSPAPSSRPPSSPSPLPYRPSSRSTARRTTPTGSPASIPRQRIRYFRFVPPTFKSTSPAIQPETAHLGTGGLQRWNAMMRWQRDLFHERLSDEVRLHYQRSQRRKIEEARDDLNRLASPRGGGGGLVSPRQRMRQPTVCNVEWPQPGRDGAAGGDGGVTRLRHWLLTSLQLHEMHRSALRTCAVVSAGSSVQAERLYVIERAVKYVRRSPVEQRDDSSADGRAERGVTTWATVKRWQQSPIMEDFGEDEVERQEQEDEIRRSKERANSIVSRGDDDSSSLARFQQQLKLRVTADDSSAFAGE